MLSSKSHTEMIPQDWKQKKHSHNAFYKTCAFPSRGTTANLFVTVLTTRRSLLCNSTLCHAREVKWSYSVTFKKIQITGNTGGTHLYNLRLSLLMTPINLFVTVPSTTRSRLSGATSYHARELKRNRSCVSRDIKHTKYFSFLPFPSDNLKLVGLTPTNNKDFIMTCTSSQMESFSCFH